MNASMLGHQVLMVGGEAFEFGDCGVGAPGVELRQ
jgi:hypothetical protein